MTGVTQIEQVHTDNPYSSLMLSFAALCAAGSAYCRREGSEGYKRAAALEQANRYDATLASAVQQLGADMRAAGNAVADAVYELADTQSAEPEPTNGIEPSCPTTYL